MKVWNQAPLVRLLLPFLAGILLAVYCPFRMGHLLWCSATVFTVIAATALIPKFSSSYRRSFWFGCFLNFLLIVLAYQLTLLNTQKFSPMHFSKYIRDECIVHVRLSDAYIEKEKSVKMVMEILAVKRGEEWIPCIGKALVYIQTDSLALDLNYGEELLLKATFKDVKPPQNPGAFNYQRFLSFHNIFQQTYLKSNGWKSLERNSGNFLMRHSINLRSRLLEIFEQNKLTGDELSVGAALLLGYTDKLDADLVTAYSSTGALHVLSVSGLHVAIVYIVFSWFLFFLNKNKYTRILKAILLLLFLWFYAALTGLSPSVLRAATMFSFIIVAKATNRHTNIYNTLAASAFLLLLINPYLLMEVGFQLSYLAVIGIVYIQPKIYEAFEFDNWLLDQSWNVTAVSIAAQIATFPLGLHYFQQFPNYFLLSNLIVIPISTLIIYVGIALFAFSSLPLFAKYLAVVFSWLIWFLNASVKWIEALPYALLEGISISVLETLLLYGLVILFLTYLSERKYKYLIAVFVLSLILLLSQLKEQGDQLRQRKMIVYSINKTTAVDFIYAKENILLTDSTFAKDKNGLLFHVKHNWWELGMTESTVITGNFQNSMLMVKENFICFLNKRIFILSKDVEFKVALEEKIVLDYLIISKDVRMSVAEMRKHFRTKMIIFDASNPESRIKKWKSECDEIGQDYYSTSDSGAMEIDL